MNTVRRLKKALKWGCLIPLVLIFAIISALFVADRFIPSSASRALPASASEIQEYYSDSWNGDYVRCIKAKLPEAEVSTYASHLGLTHKFDPANDAIKESTINIGFGDAPIWWNPPRASQTTFFNDEKGHEFVQVLKYSEGYVYFLSLAW